jgi:hypothetical protein
MISFNEFIFNLDFLVYIVYNRKYNIVLIMVYHCFIFTCINIYHKNDDYRGIFGIIFLKEIPLYIIRNDPCKLCDILFGLMLFII